MLHVVYRSVNGGISVGRPVHVNHAAALTDIKHVFRTLTSYVTAYVFNGPELVTSFTKIGRMPVEVRGTELPLTYVKDGGRYEDGKWVPNRGQYPPARVA